jgi:hypothetical protein
MRHHCDQVDAAAEAKKKDITPADDKPAPKSNGKKEKEESECDVILLESASISQFTEIYCFQRGIDTHSIRRSPTQVSFSNRIASNK